VTPNLHQLSGKTQVNEHTMADQDLGDDMRALLGLVQAEMRASIGFETDADLIGQRETATLYSRGIMRDVPALQNRSRAVSTDVEDAIQTALPDLIEIFAEGEDAIAFTPLGVDDEAQARQESDYVRHVVFQQNDGFGHLYTYLLDALKVKTGLFTWWWEDADLPEPKRYAGKSAVEVGMLVESFGPEAVAAKPLGNDLYDVTVQEPQKAGKCRIAAFDPNDFTICRDAVSIAEATYCARRSRPRAQDLIAMGLDPALVELLPTWAPADINAAELARDTVMETGASGGGLAPELRQVLVVEHYLRRVEDGRVVIWQVLTDWACGIVLKAERVNRINIAAGTPFRNAHRFYGTSLADKLIEIQRIKTALWRMSLDSGYFAINQRPIVNMQAVNEFTLADLMNNIPGAVIRVDGDPGGVVQMAGGASLNYDPLSSLEYASTVAEQRTGIVRNAQGLNPDTLHDTATGAIALMTQAQKRLRLIARCLAEGLRDLYLGVHATLCENASGPDIARLRGQWLPVNPSEWARRNDMTVEIGQGAANGAHALMVAQTLGQAAQQMVTIQGGLNGPLQNPQSLRAIALDMAKALGKKNPEVYFPDPASYQPPAAPVPPSPPDPAMLKVQLEARKHQAEGQARAAELELKYAQLQADIALKNAQISAEMELKKYEIDAGIVLQREQAMRKARGLEAQGDWPGADVHVGGEGGR
jgi:hypothetical protein